ncbi:MAG: pyridoxal phosphate-dependent aminotransferase [Boseongicola sp. SB0676_bin_33]|uniref:Aminotransferase n=1 Tax=Boseongicola sp. SB0664_bin_43 TaxID=2604844 RepID=A0A6B0Y2Z8_9RHOB|nr:pyridoxal phosphate-dependent aminotransferase [Boseongicola sp. SB0664_bin_43]MYF89938.1 pyridoxal phosphate-dependent aminotransferase [Boseongicola sp. SB0676_bin_33]
MRLSHRIKTLTDNDSDGWDIYRKGRAMKDRGLPVVELTIGEHDRKTDPSILEAMQDSAVGGHTGYATIPGTDGLRDAVAKRIANMTGVATERHNVVITAGGQAALLAAHMTACDPGDAALYIDPYYATYPGTIRATGAMALAVTARPEHGFQPSRTDLEQACDARSLLINSPNNPTGAVYSRTKLQEIAAFTRQRDMWLISDEVYDTQVWEGEHISPRALPGMESRTLVAGSLSKSHAMTGSRIGWLIGPEEAIRHAINLATHTNYGLPGFLQDAGEFALQQGPALEDAIAAPFRRRHKGINAILLREGLNVVPSVATMYVMIDIRATGMTGVEFAEALLDEHLVAVMPGESFGKAAAGHVRVALTVEDAALENAAMVIASFFRRCASSARTATASC